MTSIAIALALSTRQLLKRVRKEQSQAAALLLILRFIALRFTRLVFEVLAREAQSTILMKSGGVVFPLIIFLLLVNICFYFHTSTLLPLLYVN